LRHNLFCYGSLQFPTVIEAVVGRRFRGRRADLDGYAAFEVRRAEYPGIRRCPGRRTPGQVYFDLTATELAILDRFEGRLYTRRRLAVRTRDGRRRGAWVFVVRPLRTRRLSAALWDPRVFRQRRFRRFMQRFVRDRRPVFDPQG
jgi:gamma-glutamylcyclotransferase (GGCT)/AIG2-like uncharacterized protein YtfP